MNLNEDGILNRKIFVDLSKHTKADVGRKAGDHRPVVELGGAGIQVAHATFETSGTKTMLVPTVEAAFEHITINGLKMTSSAPRELKPNDRIIFGGGSVFLYKCKDAGGESMSDSPEITFELAIKEKGDIEGAAMQ